MAKLRLDQTAAWFLSLVGTAGIIGGGMGVLKYTFGSEREIKRITLGSDKSPSKSAERSLEKKNKDFDHENKSDHNDGVDSNHSTRWGYEAELGPKHWGELSPEYVDCMDGRAQSPINIESAVGKRDLRPIKFSYRKVAAHLVNNGHTLQAVFQEGGFMSYNGKRFDLIQFHFHLPSEHLVKGVPYEMEMHLVHKNTQGDLAVVAVFLEESDRGHTQLNKIWRGLPRRQEDTGKSARINPNLLLPSIQNYYAYKGSLTTPPCSEDVQWLVLRKSMKVSAKQVETFNLIFRDNARPTQRLHGRKIAKSLRR